VPHHLVDIRDPASRTAPRRSRPMPRAWSARSARAAAVRCWPAAPCCTSRRCSTAWTPCRRAPELRARSRPRRRARLAGAACGARAGRPATAQRLAPNDAQRIQPRAGGVPRHRHAAERAPPGPLAARGLRPAALLSLEPARPRLAARAHRAALRRHAGGRLPRRSAAAARPRRPAPRPAQHALRGLPAGLGGARRRLAAGTLRERGIFATRQLAKRQLTWLRGMERRTIACDAPDAQAQVLARRARGAGVTARSRWCVEGLAKRYGDTHVFRDVTLDVRRGEFVAIVGESGVGKSTLLNCLAGLDDWDAGRVVVRRRGPGRPGRRGPRAAAAREGRLRVPGLPRAAAPGRGAERRPAAAAAGPARPARVEAMLDAVGLGGLGSGCRSS
jgi:hypothetical protein